MPSLAERYHYIQAKVIVTENGCHEYPSQRRAYLTVDGIPELVYRIVYKFLYGEVPKGLNVLHSCDNKTCCNPTHLELGTQRINALQAVERGLVQSASPLAGVSFQSTRKRWLVMPRIEGRKTVLYAGKDFFEAVCALKSWQSGSKLARITPE